MKVLQTPKDKDWDRFWGVEKNRQSPSASWSKQRILKVIAPYCLSSRSVLDAGCGSGFFSKYFSGVGMSVTALDYSRQALEMTRSITSPEVKLIEAELVNDVLSSRILERFDLVFTDGLFEHFSRVEQDKIMKNFLSVLKPQGKIVTFVPNRWSPWELIRPFYMPGIDEQPFVIEELLSLNKRNGLHVDLCGGINVLPFRFSVEAFGPRFGMLLYSISSVK